MADNSDDWMSAAEAVEFLEPVMGIYEAQMTICARANDGLIRARARAFFVGQAQADSSEVPTDFWWDRGGTMLKQNWQLGDFETWIRDNARTSHHCKAYGVQFLRSQIMEIVPASTRARAQPNARGQTRPAGTKIFIGHGHSAAWRELKDFIVKLGLPYDEFNAESVAGKTITKRLTDMLDNAAFAFLVLTAEDEQPSGNMRARMNVIHEAGLFQGRLGFEMAIILLEEGCEEFSNIKGLVHIPFPRGAIRSIFEDVRDVLKRESILTDKGN
jgi:predicted nucleotide-binding protein